MDEPKKWNPGQVDGYKKNYVSLPIYTGNYVWKMVAIGEHDTPAGACTNLKVGVQCLSHPRFRQSGRIGKTLRNILKAQGQSCNLLASQQSRSMGWISHGIVIEEPDDNTNILRSRWFDQWLASYIHAVHSWILVGFFPLLEVNNMIFENHLYIREAIMQSDLNGNLWWSWQSCQYA